METLKANAKAKEVRGTNSQSDGENDRQRLEGLGRSSFSNGIGQQNRFIGRDCPKDDSADNVYPQRKDYDHGSDTGKILEEVLLLKEQFLSYVKSDQSLLEAKLDESKKQEQQFLANAEVIEKRLRAALAIQHPTNEESHITNSDSE